MGDRIVLDGELSLNIPLDGEAGTVIEVGHDTGIDTIVFNPDYTLTFNMTNGETFTTGSIRGEQGQIGAKGEQGDDYVLTQQDKEDIAELVDTPVDDVQINGTSVVENGVVNIPVADSNVLGVVKVNASYGIKLYGNQLAINQALDSHIKTGSGSLAPNRPITPDKQHMSVFYGLAKVAGHDEKDSTLPVGQYTDEAKSAIQEMIGVGDFEIIKTVELTEDSEIIEIDTDEAGNPFKLTEMAFLMNASPSTATTANTNAYIKNRHTTYCATVSGVVRPSATVFFGSIKNIFVSESNSDANFVILNISNSQPSYWNLKHPTGNEKNYSEYFAVYTTGTSKFGAGTKITLLGRKK